jgi:opine dehydrogenase
MVTSPAIGHEAFFEALSPYLREGQCVLVNTGCWASLRMAPILKDLSVLEKITLAEANIMPYLSDKQEYRARIFNVKQDIKLATFPGDKKSRIFDIIQLIYPQHKRVPNVLWTNFAPGNPSVHAPIALPMAGLVLERNETSKFYAEATTCAARLCEAFDKERIAIASSLGCDVETAFQYGQKTYGYIGKDIADAYRNSPHAERSIPRERIRVILEEDLAFFYVPLVQLGKLLGISTPISQGIIEIMGAMLNIDYWEKGVTVEQLGFAGLSAEQIVRYVNTGSK